MRKLFYLLLVFVIFAFTNTANSEQPAGSVGIGKNAPGFELRDINGKIHNLEDYRGKYVVLEWINFDCPFVVKHYSSDNMQSLQRKYTEKGVVWLSVCSSAPGKQGNFDNEEIKNRIKKSKAAMSAYLIDSEGIVGKLYSAKTTPHIFIVDTDGLLVYQGAIDDKKSTDMADIKNSVNYISTTLDNLLSGKRIDINTTQPYGCSVKYKD